MHMDVDETGYHHRVGQVDVGGVRCRARTAAHDLGARRFYPARPADAPLKYDSACGDQWHTCTSVAALSVSSGQRPLFSQKWRMSSSCRPLVSGAHRDTRKKPKVAIMGKTGDIPAPA